MKKILAFLTLSITLVACQTTPISVDKTASSIENGLPYLSAIGESEYHRLDSEILDRPFHLYIKLPNGYDSQKQYPVAYLLDGGLSFPLLAGYEQYLSFDGEIADIILVGIAYSGPDFENGNYRSTDFTAPSVERDFWGGAEAFQTVFEREVFPHIEAQYAADPAKRIVWGQSLGGQFALYSALTRPDLFWGHIASNPALHRNLDFFLNYDVSGQARGNYKLYVSSGQNDDPVFRKPAMNWISKWQTRSDLPFDLKTQSLPGHTHFSPAPTSFRNGLIWLFEREGGDE